VSDPGVDALRQQLRERGYLSHGIERWFALDPWSSRTFWLELAIVAAKAAVAIALFATVPMTAIVLFRNHPLTVLETVDLALIYGAGWAAVAFLFILAVALVLKLRPALAVDTPRALLGISLAAAALLTLLIAGWWSRFPVPPSTAEVATGLVLLIIFFLVVTIIVSAALLSFSIYELQRVPAIHQRSRRKPMAVAAAGLLALLFVPAYGGNDRTFAPAPLQVVVTPSARRVALLAVDGLTHEIFASRSTGLRVWPVATARGASTAERWASVGTGVPPRYHGVRAIEGVRFRGGSHMLQSISTADVALRTIAPAIGLAVRAPLPPTVRRRDFVWEVFAQRGVPVLAVNWWTSETSASSVAQQTIFAAAKGDPLAVDALAIRRAFDAHAQFVTAYLPALDVILNRLPLDRSAQLAQSVRALDQLSDAIGIARERGYDVLVIGMPGDRQNGHAVLASTLPLAAPRSAYDIAPTLCALFGFPATEEMRGSSLAGSVQRIPSYGTRNASASAGKVDEEYYQNLKSLGYIK
jgi:hypothetical protein